MRHRTLIVHIALVWLLIAGVAAHAQITKVLPYDGNMATTGNIPTVAIANLPTCNAANNGLIFQVTNALLPVILTAVVGGGGITVLVHCNGTAYIAG